MGFFTSTPKEPRYMATAPAEWVEAWQTLAQACQRAQEATAGYEAAKGTGDADAIATGKETQLKAMLATADAISVFSPLDEVACRTYTAGKRKELTAWLKAFEVSLKEGGFNTGNGSKESIANLAKFHAAYLELTKDSKCPSCYRGMAAELERQRALMLAELTKVRRGRGDWWAAKVREEKNRTPNTVTVMMPVLADHDGFHFHAPVKSRKRRGETVIKY